MKEEQIKQAVEEYFKEMFAEDADYLDNITDSWIDDAEDWFVENYKKFNISFEEGCEFRQHARKRFAELYDEKYGERDAIFTLNGILYDVQQLRDKYKGIEKHIHYYECSVDGAFDLLIKYLKETQNTIRKRKEEEGKNESILSI